MKPRLFIASLGLLVAALTFVPTSASAAAPAWSITVSAVGGHFSPGSSGSPTGPAYLISAKNIGDAPTSGPFTVKGALPTQLTAVAPILAKDDLGHPLSCEQQSGQIVACTSNDALDPGAGVQITIPVDVDDVAPITVKGEASVSGGGAVGASTTAATLIAHGAAAWALTVSPFPANFKPGENSEYMISAVNIGAVPTSGPPSIVQIVLPPELEPEEVTASNTNSASLEGPTCALTTHGATCETTGSVGPGREVRIGLTFKVAPGTPEAPLADAEVSVSGGDAPEANMAARALVGSDPLDFGILAGLRAPLTEIDGSPTTLAGSHPFQQTVDFGFPILRTRTEKGNSLYSGSGHPHEIRIELPSGLITNPTATPVLCTETELTSDAGCPEASQLGTLGLTTLLAEGFTGVFTSNLYNMVPPPGYPAELAFNAASAGIYVHILGSVRSEGDFGIEAVTRDIPALGKNPIFDLSTQLWGDPSGASHDGIRGICRDYGAPSCPVDAQRVAFLTNPTECSGHPITSEVSADSWEEPGLFKGAAYQSADLQGNAVSATGCNQLFFDPTILAQPTTNLADSPSGLDVDLHQPQDSELGHRSTAQLEDATVTLPAGMAVNPSEADGLDTCREQQVGFLAADPEPGNHFSKQPAACPDASKLGTVEVTTPLIAQYTEEGTKLATDPETGKAIPRPLHGSVYLAKPIDNPFGSLLAIYLTVEDPQTGTVAKLAGQIEPDPGTGQLTTTFSENPQLPIEDIRLHLFGGARGPLITPPTCGTHTATTDLVPWSSPEGADAHPKSSFQITGDPAGGSCPTSAGAATNSPSFVAGTIGRQAGAYSPFVLKFAREDGSQRLAGIDTTLAPGLTGKLAGIAECPEAAIARAASRSNPEEGILERRDPSCPASTQVGVVNVGAGAGPTPIYTQGQAYLAGPYKGAPLSLAIVTPAIAGPFDLGTVVVRTALFVDPVTAQIHAVSDPFPQILDGIPLDIRSVALQMDRPDFTLNPTSCNPLAITGTAASALGQGAALNQRFQVGGCSALPFKPKLSLRLKGSVKRSSNPALIATLSAKGGEANVARAQVKLPHAVFLDQSHIRTVCTRVQFAADACPGGSVYGKVSATTPLLGYPLTGSVYLRSSNHKLPDLVAKLKGPAFQPIEIDLDGKTDAVKGALRNTFEAVPDAPVTRFRLELFGGKRGLVEMSDGFCSHRRATINLDGQNGKTHDTRPVVAAKCSKKHGGAGRSTSPVPAITR